MSYMKTRRRVPLGLAVMGRQLPGKAPTTALVSKTAVTNAPLVRTAVTPAGISIANVQKGPFDPNRLPGAWPGFSPYIPPFVIDPNPKGGITLVNPSRLPWLFQDALGNKVSVLPAKGPVDTQWTGVVAPTSTNIRQGTQIVQRKYAPPWKPYGPDSGMVTATPSPITAASSGAGNLFGGGSVMPTPSGPPPVLMQNPFAPAIDPNTGLPVASTSAALPPSLFPGSGGGGGGDGSSLPPVAPEDDGSMDPGEAPPDFVPATPGTDDGSGVPSVIVPAVPGDTGMSTFTKLLLLGGAAGVVYYFWKKR